MVTVLLVTAGTIVQAFASTGPPPYFGQGDPVRFSFNPKYWVWSFGEAEGRVSIRGRWGVEPPDVGNVDPNPATGPLVNLPALRVVEQRRSASPPLHEPTDIGYDAGSDRFVVTTKNGIYITDGAVDRIVRWTAVDPLFSVDLGPFAGAGFLDSHTVIAVSQNKSYVVERESDKADPVANYRFFLENPDKFEEVGRSRFATIRARLMYIMSAAVDPATHAIYTITVPNVKTKRWVVSRFDADDMQLSEEFLPTIAPQLAGSAKNPLDAFYVTGATIAGGKLYALSAAHSTLLTLDLASHAVVEARTIPGIAQPTGIARKSDRYYVVTRDGTLTIVE
jgi:disulfide bond formation protein DsbB